MTEKELTLELMRVILRYFESSPEEPETIAVAFRALAGVVGSVAAMDKADVQTFTAAWNYHSAAVAAWKARGRRLERRHRRSYCGDERSEQENMLVAWLAKYAMLSSMEIKNSPKASYEAKVIFVRLTPEMYEQLEKLRVRLSARGIATVIKRILETALAEGISVRDDKAAKGMPVTTLEEAVEVVKRGRAKRAQAAINGDAGEEES